jgi:hypothetical protein
MAQILDALNSVFQSGLTDPTSLIYKAITGGSSKTNFINEFVWPRLADLKLLNSPVMPKFNIRFRHGHDGEPGETIIHGISYVGYNSILGKTTPQHWGQAESARLTMSQVPSMESNEQNQDFSEEQNQAFHEVISAQMEPTIIVEQGSDILIEQEILQNSDSSIKVVDANDLFDFKCLATLRINNYIYARGSYSNTDSGEQIWTTIGEGRNYLRSTFGFYSVDVPQVNRAKQLKAEINTLTVNNLNENWPGLKMQLDKCATNLPDSKEYTSLIKAIIKDFSDKKLDAGLSSHTGIELHGK